MNIYSRQQQRRLQNNLEALNRMGTLFELPGGWLWALRIHRKMGVREFANKMGVAPSNISRFERAEKRKSINLKSLIRVARALDCEVIWALVPKENVQSRTSMGISMKGDPYCARCKNAYLELPTACED